MKNLVVANWKMNPTSQKEAKQLFDAVKKSAKNLSLQAGKNVQVIICPPFVYLPLLKGATLGAQDVFFETKGAFTGEISAQMLADLNVEYVILGHSERRKYTNETDEIINKKVKSALASGLKIILCIGETAEQQEIKSEILEKQLTEGLKNISRDNLKNIVVAYEPVWAIGTGQNCSPDQTLSSIVFIKKVISQLYSRELADSTKILYGGSVNSDNARSYVKEAGTNGLLVGGASLSAEEFIKIVNLAT